MGFQRRGELAASLTHAAPALRRARRLARRRGALAPGAAASAAFALRAACSCALICCNADIEARFANVD